MTPLDVIEGRARWCVVEGDNREVLPTLPDKSVAHVIEDPPYSGVTHAAAAAAAAAARPLPDGSVRRVYNSQANGFGFDCLAEGQREALAVEFARLAQRWVLSFTDQEGAGDWMRASVAAGLDHVRIGQWIKEGQAPQFTGDRPGNGAEAVVIAHVKGRKRWNGGGQWAVFRHPIAALEAKRNGDGRSDHITPKPVSLMLELVELFTDPGDIILDPFCGSGTTGVACLRLGRRFIGIEKAPHYAAVARERLQAEAQGLTLRDARAGQLSLLGGTP
jgi:site-specific DNA-methyltransferase (adenine-specific)